MNAPDNKPVKVETTVKRYNAAGDLIDTTKTISETERATEPGDELPTGMYL